MNNAELVERLKSAGHSAAKAMEITLDYSRGCTYAKAWVAALEKDQSDDR